MALPYEPKRATYSEYVTWGDNVRCEALDGQLVNMTPAPTPKHQDVLAELTAEFRMYLRGKQCKAFSSPIDVCLFATPETPFEDIKDWVQPDLVVVCDKNKIDDKRIVGAPDLVIEVLSPSTAKNDRVLKYTLYEKAGIKEYWIVDPYNQSIDVYILEDGSQYKHEGVYFKKDTLPVQLFADFNIELDHIFIDENE